MKKLWRLAAVAAFAVVLTGCIESVTTISLDPGGAGTVTETVHVNRAAERMLAVLANLGTGLESAAVITEEAPPPVPPARAFYEARAAAMGDGVSLLELKIARRGDGVTGLTAIYSFADVRTLKVPVEVLCPGLFPVYGSPLQTAALTTSNAVTFGFSPAPGQPRRLTVHVPWAAGAREASARQRPAPTRTAASAASADDLALWRHVLGGFNARMLVRTSSPILRTDASFPESDPNKPEERFVKLFELNLGETVRADSSLDRLLAAGPVATMAEALSRYAAAPGVRVETRDSVTVEF